MASPQSFGVPVPVWVKRHGSEYAALLLPCAPTWALMRIVQWNSNGSIEPVSVSAIRPRDASNTLAAAENKNNATASQTDKDTTDGFFDNIASVRDVIHKKNEAIKAKASLQEAINKALESKREAIKAKEMALQQKKDAETQHASEVQKLRSTIQDLQTQLQCTKEEVVQCHARIQELESKDSGQEDDAPDGQGQSSIDSQHMQVRGAAQLQFQPAVNMINAAPLLADSPTNTGMAHSISRASLTVLDKDLPPTYTCPDTEAASFQVIPSGKNSKIENRRDIDRESLKSGEQAAIEANDMLPELSQRDPFDHASLVGKEPTTDDLNCLETQTKASNATSVRTNDDGRLDSSEKNSWTTAEENLLMERWKYYGKNWTLVADGLSGRTSAECRERKEVIIRRKDVPSTVEASTVEGRGSPVHHCWPPHMAQMTYQHVFGKQARHYPPESSMQQKPFTAYSPVYSPQFPFLAHTASPTPRSGRGRPRVGATLDTANQIQAGKNSSFSASQCEQENLARFHYTFGTSLTTKSEASAKPKSSTQAVQDSRKDRPWTREEEECLKQRHLLYGTTLDPFKWDKIAEGIPGRSAQACMSRWYIGLPMSQSSVEARSEGQDTAVSIPIDSSDGANSNYGHNSARENHTDDLMAGEPRVPLSRDTFSEWLKQHKPAWRADREKLKSHEHDHIETNDSIQGRSERVAAESFPLSLEESDSQKYRNWTTVEDDCLKLRIKLYGNKWEKVSEGIPCRSAEACRKRLGLLLANSQSIVSVTEEEQVSTASLPAEVAEETENSLELNAARDSDAPINDGRKSPAVSHFQEALTATSSRHFRQAPIRFRTESDSLKRRAWTPEEDRTLKERWNSHGGNWVTIAEGLPDRSSAECRERYDNIFDASSKAETKTTTPPLSVPHMKSMSTSSGRPRKLPARYRTEDDDKPDSTKRHRASQTVQSKQRGSRVGATVGASNQTQCGKRSSSSVSTSLMPKLDTQAVQDSRNPRPWTNKEDICLKQRHSLYESKWKHREYGNKWYVIAKGLPGRSAAACETRWRKVKNKSHNFRAHEATLSFDLTDGIDCHFVHNSSGDIPSEKLNLAVTSDISTVHGSRKKRPGSHAWTRQEITCLKQRHEIYGSNKKLSYFNKWDKIAEGMPGRSAAACEFKWRYVKADTSTYPPLVSTTSSGRSRNLSARFRTFFDEPNASKSDVEMAAGVAPPPVKRNRTEHGWRQRKPTNFYVPPEREEGKNRPWSDDETNILLQCRTTHHGMKWEDIAKKLPGRTAQACKSRFEKVDKEHKEALKRKRKADTVSNDEKRRKLSARKPEKAPANWTLPPIATNGNLPRRFNWIKAERDMQPAPPKPPRWTEKDLRMVKSLL